MKAKINKVTINITLDNILLLEVDGLVNSTDPNLSLPDELVKLGGLELEKQVTKLVWCDVGDAQITDSGDMVNVKKIIHAVGPRWGEGSERGKLANATWATLSLAEENKLKSLALPAISVGTLGYPVENCARTMLEQIIDFTFEKLKSVRTITICLDSEHFLEIFRKEFKRQLESLKNSGEGKIRA